MPFLKQSSLENLRARISIVDVVSPYTQLKKIGHEWKGLSPFSSEKTPSFYVDPTKNVFYCFSTGQGGDIFRFVQIKENLSFPEAIETLAHRFNIPLEYEEGSGAPNLNRSLVREIYEVNEIAADYYHRVFLSQTREGLFIREFWEKLRGFPPELAKDFRIGLSPTNAAELIKLVRAKNFSPEALRQCGLFFTREDDLHAADLRPRFRGRLMIPIRDIQKRVVGFAARQTELTPRDTRYEEGKYVNSPETPVFKKGHILFNLDRAKDDIGEQDAFLLVEGQLDAMRCFSCGLRTAIAPQGTAITEDQIRSLRNYSRKIECLLDGDSAGQRAALRILPMVLQAGMEMQILVLPQGKDPDCLLQEEGVAAIERLRAQALSPMAFAVKAHLPQDHLPTPREKADAFGELARLILLCESEIVRQGYLNQAARLLGIDAATATRDFELIRRAAKRQSAGAPALLSPAESEPARLTSAEEDLLLVVLNHDALATTIAQHTPPEWIDTQTTAGRLLDRLLAALREQVIENARQFDGLVEDESERAFLMDKYALPERFDEPQAAAAQAFEALQKTFLRAQRALLENKLSHTTDFNEQKQLFDELLKIRSQIARPAPLFS